MDDIPPYLPYLPYLLYLPMDRMDDIAYILPYLPYRTIYKTKKKFFSLSFSFPSPWFVFLPNRKTIFPTLHNFQKKKYF